MSGYFKKTTIIAGTVLVLGLTGCQGELNNAPTEETEYSLETESQQTENVSEQKPAAYLEPTLISEKHMLREENASYEECEIEITIGEEKQKLQFQWVKVGNDIFLKTNDSLPDGMSIETITGNFEKVVLLVGEKQGNLKSVYLCDLTKKSLTTMFAEDISGYGAYEVEISSDLKNVVLNTAERTFYYNGAKMIDLAEVCKQEKATRVIGTLVGDKVLLSADVGSNQIAFYTYDPRSNTAQETIELQSKKLKRYGDAYATDVQDNKLIVWNLMTGKNVTTDIKEADVEHCLSIDEESFLVITTENKLCVVNKESGTTTFVSDKGVDLAKSKSFGITVDVNGVKYLCVQREADFAYYKVK